MFVAVLLRQLELNHWPQHYCRSANPLASTQPHTYVYPTRSQGSDLSLSSLQLRPELRISAKDALHSTYFTSVLPKSIYAIDNCEIISRISFIIIWMCLIHRCFNLPGPQYKIWKIVFSYQNSAATAQEIFQNCK